MRNVSFPIGAAIVLLAEVLGFACSPVDAAPSFVTFDAVQGASLTNPRGINAHGDVAGVYDDSAGHPHAFIRGADGVIVPFDAKHAVETIAQDINDFRQVTGFFDTQKEVAGGFIANRNGRITDAFTFSSEISPGPQDINNAGQVVGTLKNPGFQGFVYEGGVLGAFLAGGGASTFASCINDSNVVTGHFLVTGSSTQTEGFVLDRNSSAESDFVAFGGVNTVPTGINAGGTVVGAFDNGSAATHGFVRTSDGGLTAFDPPGATATFPTGINTNGDIVGWFDDSTQNGQTRGFVLKTTGKYTLFDVPGVVGFTTPNAINDKGVITGDYFDGNVTRGFIRFPR